MSYFHSFNSYKVNQIIHSRRRTGHLMINPHIGHRRLIDPATDKDLPNLIFHQPAGVEHNQRIEFSAEKTLQFGIIHG